MEMKNVIVVSPSLEEGEKEKKENHGKKARKQQKRYKQYLEGSKPINSSIFGGKLRVGTF